MPTKWLGIGCQQQLTAVSRGLAPIGHKTACSSTHSPVLLVGGWHHKSVPMAPQSESCGRTGGRKDVFDRPGRANASSSHIFTMSRQGAQRRPYPSSMSYLLFRLLRCLERSERQAKLPRTAECATRAEISWLNFHLL